MSVLSPEMLTAVAALIGALGSALVALVTALRASAKASQETAQSAVDGGRDVLLALVNQMSARLDSLERRVDLISGFPESDYERKRTH